MFWRREVRVGEQEEGEVDYNINNSYMYHGAHRTTATTTTAADGEICYYDYDHATGRHILKNNHATDPFSQQQQSKSVSWKCICCNLIDLLLFAGYIAFLYFAIRYALYCLENSDGGD